MIDDELKARVAAIFGVPVEDIDAVDAVLRPFEEQLKQRHKKAWDILRERLEEDGNAATAKANDTPAPE